MNRLKSAEFHQIMKVGVFYCKNFEHFEFTTLPLWALESSTGGVSRPRDSRGCNHVNNPKKFKIQPIFTFRELTLTIVYEYLWFPELKPAYQYQIRFDHRLIHLLIYLKIPALPKRLIYPNKISIFLKIRDFYLKIKWSFNGWCHISWSLNISKKIWIDLCFGQRGHQ